MYCVECGKDTKLYEKLCEDCFIRKMKFYTFKKVLKLTLCSQCNARKVSNHWVETTSVEDGIREALIESINPNLGIKNPKYSIKLIPDRTNIFRALISINAEFEDLKINDELEMEVRLNYHTCNRCSKLSGSYFEAIIQVRSTNRELDENELGKAEDIVITTLEHSEGSEQNAFLTKTEYIHGGVDFYIGSSAIARQITKKLASEFAGKIKESSSLIGKKDGKDVFRVTFIVRIPEYRIGDFIRLDDNVYKVLKILQKKVTCQDLKTGQVSFVSHTDSALGTILGGDELIFDAVVVSENTKEVQVLDPENYSTVELIKPQQNFEVNGDSVKIFKSQDMILLIPNLRNRKSPGKKFDK